LRIGKNNQWVVFFQAGKGFRMLSDCKIRIARPSSNLERTRKFYRDVLKMKVLSQFFNHDGFDGLMLGYEDQQYHFEFTYDHNNPVKPTPTSEDLIVFYVPDNNEWNKIILDLENSGVIPVKSHNPYWDKSSRTYQDPDGYRIVICNEVCSL